MTFPSPSHETASRVLVVDDEKPLVELVAEYLRRDGFDVATAADGREAIAAARDWKPAVIILDLGLPGIDGVEVCRTIRTFSDCYIIMLTARVDEIDKLIGLSVGADDYLTKPFSPRELIARVRVMLRRPRPSEYDIADTPPLVFGSLTINIAGHEILQGGQTVELTRTEFDILAELASQPRIVFSRDQLIRAVWGSDWVGDPHLVDVHVGHLRRKLGDDPTTPTYIRTIRGVGYQMGTGRRL